MGAHYGRKRGGSGKNPGQGGGKKKFGGVGRVEERWTLRFWGCAFDQRRV